MNMYSTYNLKKKKGLKIEPCIDSTWPCSYVPLLFTRKEKRHRVFLETALCIPGLLLFTLRVTSWPTTALKLALPWSPKTSESLNPMVTSLPSSCWTFWQQLTPTHTICLKPFHPLDTRTTLLPYYTLFLPLFSHHTLNDGHPRFFLYPPSYCVWSLSHFATHLL